MSLFGGGALPAQYYPCGFIAPSDLQKAVPSSDGFSRELLGPFRTLGPSRSQFRMKPHTGRERVRERDAIVDSLYGGTQSKTTVSVSSAFSSSKWQM